MQIRKWLALLVSAALALSLLAGCGNGSKALSDVIADLLSGQYANVTVEIDPDLEGDLRQAVHEGETDAEIRAALEKILGSGVSFRLIGDGQQGDSAFDLILYPGNDPDAAARSAFTEWNKVFGSLPRDGQYTAQIAMIETENGYAILVQATVDKAASRDDDDDDDDDDEPEKPYSVTMTDNKVTEVTVDAGAGFQDVLFGEGSSDSEDKEEKALAAARENGFDGVTIELAAGKTYTVSQTFTTTSFKGILKGKSPDEKATITLTGGNGLFKQISSGGTVKNITFDVRNDVQKAITKTSGTTSAGAVADQNNGTITNCDVTINAGSSITAANGDTATYAGGIAGENGGAIENCHVTGSGTITGNNAGGVVGYNSAGTITGCSSTVDVTGTGSIPYTGGVVGINCGGTVTACSSTGDVTATGDSAIAGGVVGDNYSHGEVIACYATGNVTANGSDTYAGGVVGVNESSGTVTACCSTSSVSGYKAGGVVGSNANTVTACYATGDVTGNTYAGGVVGYNGRTVTACYSTGTVNGSTAGGVVGINVNTVTACYWSGSPSRGIGEGYGDTTKVTGTTTWEDATGKMNTALSGYTWKYDSQTPPQLVDNKP